MATIDDDCWTDWPADELPPLDPSYLAIPKVVAADARKRLRAGTLPAQWGEHLAAVETMIADSKPQVH